MNAIPPGTQRAEPASLARLRGDLNLLAELALAAAARGHLAQAQPILRALAALVPAHPVPEIAQALAALAAGRPQEATARLERLLAGQGGTREIKALLLLARTAEGRLAEPASHALLQEIANGPDGAARRLAARLRVAPERGAVGRVPQRGGERQ